jgi:hypothetical protein
MSVFFGVSGLFFSTIPLYCQAIGFTLEWQSARIFRNIGIGFGARAMSMGGAFIAIADDITASSYNPAGLAQLIRPEFSFGVNSENQLTKIPGADLSPLFSPDWQSVQTNPSETKLNTFAFDYVGLAMPLRFVNFPMTIGVTYQTKVSNRAKFEYFRSFDFYETYYGSSEPTMTSSALSKLASTGGINIVTLSLAIRPLEFLYIGANTNLWKEVRPSLLTLYVNDNYITGERFSEEVHTQETWRSSGGVSYDLGILIKVKMLSIGFVYKTSFKADTSFGAAASYTVTDFDGTVTNGGNSWSSAGKLNWPLSYGFGISFRPLDALTLSADYNFTQWSKCGVVWNPDAVYAPNGYPIDNPKDTRQIRAGVEYVALLKQIAIPIRIGGFKDKLYGLDVNNEGVPYYAVTFGTGLVSKNVAFDVSAIYYAPSFDISSHWFGGYPQSLVSAKISNWRVLTSISVRLGS